MGADMRSLIDELGAKSLEARDLLADVRTATKDLRLAVREANDARQLLDDAVKKMVGADIDEAVRVCMDELGKTTRDAMDNAVERVGKEFDKLANIFLTSDPRGRAPDGLDLRKLAGGS